MTSTALEAYLRRLERELRQQGLQDRRIVDEAREHLVDAVEDGLQHGLSVEAAESQALVRFGSPEIVAAHCATKRSRTSTADSRRLRLVLVDIRSRPGRARWSAGDAADARIHRRGHPDPRDRHGCDDGGIRRGQRPALAAPSVSRQPAARATR